MISTLGLIAITIVSVVKTEDVAAISEGYVWEQSGQFEGDIVTPAPVSEAPVDEGYPWEKSGKVQGDMLIPASFDRNGIPVSHGKRWPGRNLVYKYDHNFTTAEQWNIYYAFLDIYEQSGHCIGFREADSSDTSYVLITNKPDGCYATIGCTGGVQVLNIQNPGCTSKGTIIHEALHALGFFHMQADPSRDQYVWVYLQNVDIAMRHNFAIHDYLDRFGVPYDLDSIMHYSRMAFSNNGQPTIVSKSDYYRKLGGEVLTASDILKLRRMYGCE